MSGQYVIASRDFEYDTDLKVKTGQIARLRGLPNDGLLLKHGHFVSMDPQPAKEDLQAFPQCGECGRRFQHEWQRNRCGQQHEMSAAELREERREAAQKRIGALRATGAIA